MSVTYASKLTLPVNVSGTITNVEFTIKDAAARESITALGNALYWIGVTTTELVDDTTTSAVITVGGQSVTAKAGGMAQYEGEEFVYNGTKWQSVGRNDFGALAFKASASATYTPTGDVTNSGSTTSSFNEITSVGTAPSWSVSGETVTFSAGTLPTASSKTVVTGLGTFAFSGDEETITVS